MRVFKRDKNGMEVLGYMSMEMMKVMQKIKFSLFLVLFFFATHLWAASFDCNKAETMIDKAICKNSDLSRKDESLGKVYGEYALKLNGPEKKILLNSQRHWITERNDSCSDANMAEVDLQCLDNSYESRIKILRVLPKNFSFDYRYKGSESDSAKCEIKTKEDIDDEDVIHHLLAASESNFAKSDDKCGIEALDRVAVMIEKISDKKIKEVLRYKVKDVALLAILDRKEMDSVKELIKRTVKPKHPSEITLSESIENYNDAAFLYLLSELFWHSGRMDISNDLYADSILIDEINALKNGRRHHGYMEIHAKLERHIEKFQLEPVALALDYYSMSKDYQGIVYEVTSHLHMTISNMINYSRNLKLECMEVKELSRMFERILGHINDTDFTYYKRQYPDKGTATLGIQAYLAELYMMANDRGMADKHTNGVLEISESMVSPMGLRVHLSRMQDLGYSYNQSQRDKVQKFMDTRPFNSFVWQVKDYSPGCSNVN